MSTAKGPNRYFLVDVEATAPSPFSGVMTEFGVVEYESGCWFHGVLYQSMPSPDNPALPVLSGSMAGPTIASGTHAESVRHVTPFGVGNRTNVMRQFRDWVHSFLDGGRAVMFSDNPGFDFGWMNYHFDEAGLDNVFGHSSRRIGDLAAGLKGNPRETSSWKRLRRTKHTHHPVEDSQGNAEALRALLDKHHKTL